MRPDPDDLATAAKRRAAKLQPYEQSLKRFEYRGALAKTLATGNPEVTLSLLEELVERGALYTALSGQSEVELESVLTFVAWKVADHRYSQVLVEVARIVTDLYTGVFGLSPEVDAKFKDVQAVVND